MKHKKNAAAKRYVRICRANNLRIYIIYQDFKEFHLYNFKKEHLGFHIKKKKTTLTRDPIVELFDE